MKIAITNRMTFPVHIGDVTVRAGQTIEINKNTVPEDLKLAGSAGYVYWMIRPSTRRSKVEVESEVINDEVTTFNFDEGDELNGSDNN